MFHCYYLILFLSHYFAAFFDKMLTGRSSNGSSKVTQSASVRDMILRVVGVFLYSSFHLAL